MRNPQLFKPAVEKLKSTTELLLSGGFQELAFEDFYDVTLNQLEQIPDSDPDLLLVNFQTEEISNSIVMHLRFITSAYLKIHSAEYEPFLIVESISIDQFCAQEVEAFGRESDHLQITALTKALDVPVEVLYLDGSSGEHVAIHEFWPDEALKGSRKALQLIYRPGKALIYWNSILFSRINCLTKVTMISYIENNKFEYICLSILSVGFRTHYVVCKGIASTVR